MKRVNIFTPFPSDGTSFYRAWGVFNQIHQEEHLPIIFEASTLNSWAELGKYDLLFCHRPHTPTHTDYIKTAKVLGIPVWCDWDDLIDAVPSSNPAYSIYKDVKIDDILSQCDIITTSTDFMSKQYKGETIENFIPLTLEYRQPEKKEIFTIVWRGSNTHEKDWYVHLQAFVNFIKDKKDIEMFIFGAMPLFALQTIAYYIPVRKAEPVGTLQYFKALESTRLGDVMFVPLEDTPFNRAKSDCSTREALVNGMLSITPEWNNNDVYAYGNVVDKLTAAYDAWKNDYSNYAGKVAFQQRKAKEHAEKNYRKRLEILKNLLSL